MDDPRSTSCRARPVGVDAADELHAASAQADDEAERAARGAIVRSPRAGRVRRDRRVRTASSPSARRGRRWPRCRSRRRLRLESSPRRRQRGVRTGLVAGRPSCRRGSACPSAANFAHGVRRHRRHREPDHDDDDDRRPRPARPKWPAIAAATIPSTTARTRPIPAAEQGDVVDRSRTAPTRARPAPPDPEHRERRDAVRPEREDHEDDMGDHDPRVERPRRTSLRSWRRIDGREPARRMNAAVLHSTIVVGRRPRWARRPRRRRWIAISSRRHGTGTRRRTST